MSRPTPCPSCGAPATGRFCTQCGAVVGEATCSCGTLLTPGARFCHECGAPAGPAASATAVPPRARSGRPPSTAATPATARPVPEPAPAARSNLTLILAGTAFVLLAVIFAAQRAGEEGPVTPTPAAPMGGPGAVDVASMSPRERASRLFDRIMRLHEQGKRDSVQFFSSMALGIYESLGPLDDDLRYDLGRIAEVSGNLAVAAAQADTILRANPDHLLGLILSAAVATARNEGERVATLNRRLLAAESTQLASGRQEYTMHRADIDAALAAARRR